MQTTPSSEKFMLSMENPFQGTLSDDIQVQAAAQQLVDVLRIHAKSKSGTPLTMHQFVELTDENGNHPRDFLQAYTRMFKRCGVFINEIYGSDLLLKTSVFGHQKANAAIKSINTMTYEYVRKSAYGEMEITQGGFDSLGFIFSITPHEGCGDQNCSCGKSTLILYLETILAKKDKSSDLQNITPLFSTTVYL